MASVFISQLELFPVLSFMFYLNIHDTDVSDKNHKAHFQSLSEGKHNDNEPLGVTVDYRE